jgi:peroxiredoxin
MTQLGELQDALPKFEAAGVKLYAISYDDPAALAAFAEARGIGFPLLSDADSAVIRSFGILNTLVEPDEAPFYGIPFPGTYLVDEEGIIRDKYFPRHLANRESAETFIDSALGEILMGEDEPSATAGDEDVRITAFLHGGDGVLKSGPVRRLVVRFELRNGLHIFGEPVPEGMVATRLSVKGPEGVITAAPILPPSEPLELAGLGVRLQVWSGCVDIAIPLWANSKLVCVSRPLVRPSVTLDVTVRYQACDDTTCLIPRTEKLQIVVPLAASDVPDLPPLTSYGQNITTMDSMKHFKNLVRRSSGLRGGPDRRAGG